MARFTFDRQHDAMDCGPTCLRMVARHHGKVFSLERMRQLAHVDREGVSLLGIAEAAQSVGFRTRAYKISFDTFRNDLILPAIVHWSQNHFVVVHKVTRRHVHVADPASGPVKYTHAEFLRHWGQETDADGDPVGIALELEPTVDFYETEEDEDRPGFGFLWNYVRRHKRLIAQLLLGLVLGSALMLVLPFLTQAMVDIGIGNRDLDFIYVILVAQLVLFAGMISVEYIRSWILLHIGTRTNIALKSDFLIKLLKLPLGFFDTKFIGDILQRINDHNRVEAFLRSSVLNTVFSLFNIVVFGIVLAFYSVVILGVFAVTSVAYFVWILLFMRRRADIDHKRFKAYAENRSKIIQIIQGVEDIKLNNAEHPKRWEWEHIQSRIFHINIRSLAWEQYQSGGADLIIQLQGILISFLAAKAVIDGQMTLGMMMAVQFIVGQMSSPVSRLLHFVKATQDARISLDRLADIQRQDDEEDPTEVKLTELPDDTSLHLEHVNFRYGSEHSPLVLDDVTLTIPAGKTTALVGTSGSGKTTLVKLLLKFYEPVSGSAKVGPLGLRTMQAAAWRSRCGVVLQGGYLFSDTIANNIALDGRALDEQRLYDAARKANLLEFVDRLPLGFGTRIGDEGVGLSAGQRQRILIARAIYKDPAYLFLDEATNALDANNERIIYDNLQEVFEGRTVVVVAHRLSTVRNADQIVVLDQGRVVERGSHDELTAKRGAYYELVRDQLELGT